ncbi:MAG: LamG-like jellyroll fold domain-containing protein [Candidatus Paceibacterota bacterium]
MKNRAFTLIELLVVIAIVGILSSVIYSNITGIRDRARITAGIRFDSSTLHSIGDQLVGEWTFDMPQVGSLTYDTSGSNNHGTISGATYATTSGYNNKGAYSFDGVTNNINLGNNSNLKIFGTNKWAFSAWLNISGTGDSVQEILHGSTHKPRISANIISKRIVLSGYVGGVYTNVCVSPGSVYNHNQWTHVVVEADTDKYRIFVNGVEVINTPYTQIDSSFGTLYLGWPGFTGASFKGLMDDVRIYSTALSGSEVQKLYAEGKASHEVASK